MIELDVTNTEHLATLADRVREHVDGLDGVVHSIGFAPQAALGGGFLEDAVGGRGDRVARLHLLLRVAGQACLPLLADRLGRRADLRRHRRLAGLRLDGRGQGRRWSRPPATWPASSAREGIRVNLVAAGPLRSMAAKSIPGFAQFEEAWEGRAPLGWAVTDTEPAGKAGVALLSDWFPATTGEIVHVDGGFHAVGV